MTQKPRKSRKKIYFLYIGIFMLLVYLNNTTYLADPIGKEPVLLAHRAVGQDYSRVGLTGETCTAEKMLPTHDYLENTLPSIAAAFEYGADIVEFDVHRTTDNKFAVFHDWTLDCKTDGSGVTRNHTLAELQALDMGYGYTADEGETYPFRGKFVGMMPSLEQIMTTFPDKDFMIDIKSNDSIEGIELAKRLQTYSKTRTGKVMVYGGRKPVDVIRAKMPEVQTTTRPRLRKCLIRYFLLGWTGHVPPECEKCVVMVPANGAPWLWGWPNRFLQRMDKAGSRVMLIGDYNGEGFTTPYDDLDRALKLPSDYSGGIWTDRIDVLGPGLDFKFGVE